MSANTKAESDWDTASRELARVEQIKDALLTEVGPHRLWSIGTAAEYLGVSRATVERLVQRSELTIVKVGGATRYDVRELDGYIEINRRRNRKRAV